MGGVCIFIHEDLEFFSVTLDKYCKEKDIEVCAVRLNITLIQLIILTIYRSPSDNFTNFLKNLDNVLTLSWPAGHISPTYKECFQVCWGIRIPLFLPCCHLPWSISITLNQSECIFPRNSRVQMILCVMLRAALHTVSLQRRTSMTKVYWNFSYLSHKNWEEIVMEDDVNISFNKFLNTYLRIFHSCFINKCKNFNTVSKSWITKGMKTSCNRKRVLYLKLRDSNVMERKLYYRHYCKILSEVIKEAKNYAMKKLVLRQKIKLKPHGILYIKKQITQLIRITLNH